MFHSLLRIAFSIFICSFFVNSANAQTLITYGNKTVSKEEFIRAYNKNKQPGPDAETAIREYVKLYSHFKMKVEEAKSMKLDTTDQFKNDLAGFRQQIADNYLSDEKTNKKLLDEAFDRSQWDLHIIRYSVNIDESMDPADTMKKHQAILALHKQLTSGTNPVELESGIEQVDMGYITVFSLPYAYENLVYSIKDKGVSNPYRAKRAWHIFKLIDKRPSAGKWKIAQILFTFPSDADESVKTDARKKSDSVYQLLTQGADFADMAKQFSDDKLTYLNGGELPEFGTGKFDRMFETEVLNLKKDGAISKPFQTSFGFHILKRISQTPTPTNREDDGLLYELRQKLQQDERINVSKNTFSKEVMDKLGLKSTSNIDNKALYAEADSVLAAPDIRMAIEKSPFASKTIFYLINKGKITGKDWLNFVWEYKSNSERYKNESNSELWQKFQPYISLDYYRKNLESFNADFAYQMMEFTEGNLLFEVMEKMVWSKAASDSIGLKEYYAKNKTKYVWAPSADVLIMNCISEDIAKAAIESLTAGVNWRELIEVNQGELQGDSGRFEMAQIGGDPKSTSGTFSKINLNADGTASFMYYEKIYPDGEQRSFEDSRGMVINDYQDIIEKQWLEQLKLKYPLKVNESVLKTLIKK
jgi:peptidyl-prolyl cis-trans isomerase SurA